MADVTKPAIADATPTPEEPAFADVVTLGVWLRAGKTTPTRLAEYFLERLTRLGPRYNAVVTVTNRRAREEAKQAEDELQAGKDRGPLHGIPYGAKDLLAAAGYPTTWGAEPYREQTFDQDATVAAKLRAAGAILVAKLAMVEIAGGMGYRQANASFTGPGLNPWNAEAWSGGSSTGPGAALAAGLVPFAIGSETWGSIVTPATYCGVTGLRPTYGRVSRRGAMALSWTMDKLGPMTRSAHDAALVLRAIAGPDARDPTTLPQPFAGMDEPRADKRHFAILAPGGMRLQPAVLENFLASLRILAQMGDFTEVHLPDLPFNSAASLILSSEAASAFEDLIGSERALMLTAPEDRVGGIAGSLIPATDYLRSLRVRRQAIAALDEWLGDFDALVAPTMPTVAYPIRLPFREYSANYRGANIGGAGNLAGLPCVCIPNGFGERGLPTGIQFIGRAMTEGALLRLAHDVQQRSDWHAKFPVV